MYQLVTTVLGGIVLLREEGVALEKDSNITGSSLCLFREKKQL